jgi:hypothetical protein
MAVLVEAISVVVRRESLERVYAGGVRAYEIDCPNATFCTDDHLTAAAFMGPPDVRRFVERLVSAGLGFVGDDGFLDIAVVDELTGPTAQCDWLVYSRLPGSCSMCWLEGTDPGDLTIPVGRDVQSLGTMRRFSQDEVEAQLEHLGSNGRGVEVYRDRASGKLLYRGRPFSPEP